MMEKKKIVVLGAGESGTGAAVLAKDKGMAGSWALRCWIQSIRSRWQ